MNKYTLRFQSNVIADQHFKDRFPMVLDFYKRVCIAGSLSALIIFTLEFFIPTQLFFISHFLPLLPLTFYISYVLVKRQPNLSNFLLPCFCLSFGVIFNIVIAFDLIQNINILAAQTIVMIQFSFLLTPDFLINIIIILFNMTTQLIIFVYKNQEFNSFQIMFILAVCLNCISYYYQELSRRQHYQLQREHKQQSQSLLKAFQIDICKVGFNNQLNKLQLEKNSDIDNDPTMKDQNKFTEFIRKLQINTINQGTSKVLDFHSKNLEQYLLELLHFDFEKQRYLNQVTTIKGRHGDKYYILRLYLIVQFTEIKAILLRQERKDYKQKKVIQKNLYQQEQLVNTYEKSFRTHLVDCIRIWNQLQQFSHPIQEHLIASMYKKLIHSLSSYYTHSIINDTLKVVNQQFNLISITKQINYIFQKSFELKDIHFSITSEKTNVVNDKFRIIHLLVDFLSYMEDLKQINQIEIHFQHINVDHIDYICIEIQIKKSDISFTELRIEGERHYLYEKILTNIGPYRSFQQNNDYLWSHFQFLFYQDITK